MYYLLCKTLMEFIERPMVIVGLAFIIVGVALAFLARRIARAVRHNNEIDTNDKAFLFPKITGLVLVIAGFILIALDMIVYLSVA